MRILSRLLVLAIALLILQGCKGDPPTAPGNLTGSLSITTSTTGDGLDSDGYLCRMDRGTSERMGINETVMLSGIAPGRHSVELLDVASNCTLVGPNPRSVIVPHVATVATSFHITCSADPQAD